MQNFTVFDIVIVSITVLLGLKGLLRGFIKEVFGLVAIVGGIFVASRVSSEIGEQIAPLLALENKATITLIGFLLGLIAVWAVVYLVGIILSRIFSASGLGLFDRILGFLFGSAKIFFIFSIIVYGIYQIQTFKSLMNDKVANSITFPFLLKTGSFIVKLDPNTFVKKIEDKVAPKDEIEEQPDMIEKKSIMEEVSDTVKEIKETTVESGTSVVETVKETVNKKVDEIADTIKETANTTSESVTIPNAQQVEEAVKENTQGN